jgi:hypothetical protein
LLGLVHATLLRRAGGKRRHTNNRPFAEKESRRWLDAADQAATMLAAGAAGVTVIADREGDIYEMFVCRPVGVEMLIRVHHDRPLQDGSRLFTCMENQSELGRVTIKVPPAPGRPARKAVLALRARSVLIRRPARNLRDEAAKLPPEIALSLVEAREVDPPADASALHWRLLTTHPVSLLADAQHIIGFYRQRWIIEQLFRTMKTRGFDIEAVRIAENKPFENLATATLMAAIQVLQMVRDRDGVAGRPASDVLDPADQPGLEAVCATLEGKTERQKNPHRKGSLAYAAWVCARLGGWTGYYGKPGPVVMLQGLLRLNTILIGWKLQHVV